ncbi:MAG: T9SS type A sorting domain-containing protein [Chitinophagaceae bacterium]
MKNIYSKISILLFSFVLQLYLPPNLNAQCSCALGVPATPITQTVTIAPIAASTINFTFQQFDPSIGTLSCINFVNTLTGTSYSGARNTNKGNKHVGAIGSGEYVDSTNYLFSLSLLSKLSGPSITVTRPFNTLYGYDKLKARDTILNLPGDTITYGPTNFISPPTTTVNIGGDAAYLGLGTVDFAYEVNGGLITLDGGANYQSSVTSLIGGTLTLTYYWCPAALLANGMKNFSAIKKDNTILLKWDAQNVADVADFDIEYSTDGKDFVAVAKMPADHSTASSTYNYKYPLNGTNSGYAYFRIKQTTINDKPGYSAVQKISLADKTTTGISIRPNPVTTGMTIAFDRPLNGDYSIDLVNLSGQVVVNKKIRLANTNVIPVNWNSKPAPGIYFTRITNTGTMEQQIVRVVVQ